MATKEMLVFIQYEKVGHGLHVQDKGPIRGWKRSKVGERSISDGELLLANLSSNLKDANAIPICYKGQLQALVPYYS